MKRPNIYIICIIVFVPMVLGFSKLATGENNITYSNTVRDPWGNLVPRNIILIGWDGVRRDKIKKLISQNRLPNLKKLSREGTFVDINITNRTDTKAGWAEILTGYDYRITGVYDNTKFSSIPVGYSIFERLKEFYEIAHYATIAVIGKPKNLDAGMGGDPYFYIKNDLDVWDSDKMRGAFIVKEKSLKYLSDFRDVGSFFFFHFGLPDCEGHRYGADSMEYINALILCDNALGKIINKLRELGLYDVTKIYVVSDHGMNKELTPFPVLGRHRNAPEVFLITNDKLITKKSGDRLDIAPTILKRAGIDVTKLDPPLSGSPLFD